MEQSFQEMRQLTLNNFKYIRTCLLARELCQLIRTSRAFLHAEDVHKGCGFIANLCREAGCREASDLCIEAARVVTENEEHYLKLCERSCVLCNKGRPPIKPRPGRAPYVT